MAKSERVQHKLYYSSIFIVVLSFMWTCQLGYCENPAVSSGSKSSNYHRLGGVTPCSTEQEFNEYLETDKTVVVGFGASWCGPCRGMSRVCEELSSKFSDSVIFLTVDVDALPDLTSSYRIVQLPAHLFINNKVVIDRLVGVSPRALVEKVEKYASRASEVAST